MTHPAIAAGEVAVVTGAALGIGRALAKRLVEAGMRVALLDIDVEHLHDARAELGGDSAEQTAAILCDVAEIESLEHARDRIIGDWGQAPSVLVNNAVTRIGKGMDAPLADWHRAIDINLFGVVNGVRAFLPAMQDRGRAGAIINVGSKQGITNPPGHPVYNMAKAAVKTYTECLEHELRLVPERPITAHLLVPGWTTTGLNEHKPGAWLPGQVVDHMMEALGRGSFYIICPDGETTEARDKARILWGAEDITADRPPLSRWHPEWSETFRRKEPR
jgi:NAD(P)-dependent dehydrogenase (short-subunit alcohol dehydrogenase family)